MIKYLFIGMLAVFVAQDHDPEDPMYQSDPQAKAILDKTSEAFQALQSLKAELTITIELPEQDPYDQSSTVYLKGQSYKLVTEFEEIICDNKSIWRYLKDMNEVQINDYEPSENEISPANIFNIYENDFYYLYAGPVMEDGEKYDEVELSPMDKSKSYFKVKVWIHSGDHLIRKMKVFDKNGSRYTYSIKDLDTDAGLEDAFFQFDESAFPGVMIEDLRF